MLCYLYRDDSASGEPFFCCVWIPGYLPTGRMWSHPETWRQAGELSQGMCRGICWSSGGCSDGHCSRQTTGKIVRSSSSSSSSSAYSSFFYSLYIFVVFRPTAGWCIWSFSNRVSKNLPSDLQKMSEARGLELWHLDITSCLHSGSH